MQCRFRDQSLDPLVMTTEPNEQNVVGNFGHVFFFLFFLVCVCVCVRACLCRFVTNYNAIMASLYSKRSRQNEMK